MTYYLAVEANFSGEDQETLADSLEVIEEEAKSKKPKKVLLKQQ